MIGYIFDKLDSLNQWNKSRIEDPTYEYILINSNSNSNSNEFKKRPRNSPIGINNEDLKKYEIFKNKIHFYNHKFKLFNNFEFGWFHIINLIPIIGPFINLINSINLLILIFKINIKIPIDLKILLIINIFIDFLINLIIPILGNLIDLLLIKGNSRNFHLINSYLIKIGKLRYIIIHDIEKNLTTNNNSIDYKIDQNDQKILELLNKSIPKSSPPESISPPTSSIENKSNTSITANTTATTTGIDIKSSSFQPPKSIATVSTDGILVNGDNSFNIDVNDDQDDLKSIKSLGKLTNNIELSSSSSSSPDSKSKKKNKNKKKNLKKIKQN